MHLSNSEFFFASRGNIHRVCFHYQQKSGKSHCDKDFKKNYELGKGGKLLYLLTFSDISIFCVRDFFFKKPLRASNRKFEVGIFSK